MESTEAAERATKMWQDLGEQIASAVPDIVIAGKPAEAIRWAAAAEACFWKSTGEADTHDVKDVLPLFPCPQASEAPHD
jgi:hypothetical protein